MSDRLEDYRPIVGSQVIDELLMLADRVRHLRLQHINSTSVGGGVAEILTRMVPVLRDLGIDTTWDVIKGNQAFFGVTKRFTTRSTGVRRRSPRRCSRSSARRPR